MSEMIVIECDYKEGECLERSEGFALSSTDIFRRDYLLKKGWLVQNNKHYCPQHKKEKETELENAAKKCARTGNQTDLQEYLKMRENYL